MSDSSVLPKLGSPVDHVALAIAAELNLPAHIGEDDAFDLRSFEIRCHAGHQVEVSAAYVCTGAMFESPVKLMKWTLTSAEVEAP